VLTDIFRSQDLKGRSKTLWVLVVPLLGILDYLVVRGDKLEDHAIENGSPKAKPHSVAMGCRKSDVLLTNLPSWWTSRSGGVLTEEEFERMKRSIVDNASAAA
jgi:hypothetical protein